MPKGSGPQKIGVPFPISLGVVDNTFGMAGDDLDDGLCALSRCLVGSTSARIGHEASGRS